MNDSLTISIVQTNLYWEDAAANLQMLEQKIKNIQIKTELIVLPEMFSTGFSMKPELFAETMDGSSVAWMKRLSAEKRVIIVGSLIIKEIDENGKALFYNRLIWMLPNGQYGIYDKRHLFAYANEQNHYTAGEKRLIASVKGWKINLQVCYDLRFPVWARQAPSPALHRIQNKRESNTLEYDILINVANWPERRNYAWQTLLQARAIENQCYVIGVNRVGTDGNNICYSGNSMVIDPLGDVLYHKSDEEDIFTITLDKTHLNTVREKFPFWKDGDEFVIL